MIKKILRISDFRLFQAWNSEPGTAEFQRVNLIYGVNGSGKSTLGVLLAQAGDDKSWQSGLRLTVVDDAGDVVTVSAPNHALWKNIRVFNKDYVSRNLRFDADGQSTTQPLLILGEVNIDKSKLMSTAEARLAEIQEELPKQQALKQRASRAAEALATSTATLLVEELSHLGGRYAARSYNARQVKAILSGPVGTPSENVAQDLQVVRAGGLAELSVPKPERYDVTELEALTADVLGKKALSAPLAELVDDAARAAWVEKGLDLHEGATVCSFCGGPISTDRLQELEKHFDESLKALQSEIVALVGRIERAAQDVDSGLASLPAAKDLAASLRDDWKEEADRLKESATAVHQRLAALRKALDEKQSRLFTAQALPAALPGESLLSFEDAIAFLQRHNKLCSEQAQVRMEAAKGIEINRIEGRREEYEALLEEAEDAGLLADKLTEERQELEGDLRRHSQQELDASPLAESLNSDLARLLGRNDLSFHLTDEGYSIQRAGQPALYLSEGEKTAISLLYFLKSLDAHDCDRENTIVVIDDPVSSLDSNVVAGVSAHLWARLVGRSKCRQMFLLTHSFELFRSWSNLLDRLPQPTRDAEDITETTQELRVRVVRNDDGSLGRTPYLVPWPASKAERARIRSEYHYLFWRAAKTLEDCQTDPTPEKELDAAAVLPNVCRRMLEGFLSFKFPEKVGDFRAMVEAAIGPMDNSVTRTRIVTYLHQYSHNEEGDISRPVARPESISILASVFDLIRTVDPEHYDKMCNSLRVNPQLLTLT
jgi:wobble nucleotide-excising tRNase